MYLLEPHWKLVKEYMGIYKFNPEFVYTEKNISYILKHIIFEGQDEFYESIIYGYEYGIIDNEYVIELEKQHNFFIFWLLCNNLCQPPKNALPIFFLCQTHPTEKYFAQSMHKIINLF